MCSLSPVPSYESWHGIEEPEQHLSPHLEALQQLFNPSNQQLSLIGQHFMPLSKPQEPYFPPSPLPAPVFADSIKNSPPLVNHLYDECELFLMS